MLPAADVPFQLGCCHRIKILSLFGKGNAQLVVGHFDHPFGFTLGNRPYFDGAWANRLPLLVLAKDSRLDE
jgi:hypothetical protein